MVVGFALKTFSDTETNMNAFVRIK